MRQVITRQLFQAQNRLFAPLFAPKVRFSVTQNLLCDTQTDGPLSSSFGMTSQYGN